MFTPISTLVAAMALVASSSVALAQAPASPIVRVRATIQTIDATTITVKDRSGEVVTLVRTANMPVSEVYAIALTDIKPGSFVGAAAMPQADGSQMALEVLVFPEAARGTGEGHYPWDLQPQSTMTNATVADLSAAPQSVPGGQKMTLKYKDGEKVVIVPTSAPVVTFKPATADDQKELLVPGARVLINAQEVSGKPTALRMIVGRNGFVPPM